MKIKIENLETERLLLRKYRLEDIEDFIENKSDKKLYEFQPSGLKEDRQGYEQWLERILKGYRKRKFPTRVWAVVRKTDGKIIGQVGIEHVLERVNMCELSWSVKSDCYKQGYGFESMKALISYLFSNYPFHRIEVHVWQGNEASKNLALKLGFKLEGQERDARIKDGKYIDRWTFGLLKDEWKY